MSPANSVRDRSTVPDETSTVISIPDSDSDAGSDLGSEPVSLFLPESWAGSAVDAEEELAAGVLDSPDDTHAELSQLIDSVDSLVLDPPPVSCHFVTIWLQILTYSCRLNTPGPRNRASPGASADTAAGGAGC